MSHRTYDLDPISDTAVWVVCADCGDPVGVATVMEWGLLAESHYREKVLDGR